MSIIDLSLTIDNDCMTCGTEWHEKVRIEKKGQIKNVGRNTSRFILGSHSATHMDAPKHFFEDGHGIEATSLDICIGPVTCVDFRGVGKGGTVTRDMVCKMNITERMLFVFGWYEKWLTPDYYDGFPCFDIEAIEYLIHKGMKMMALDTPSPDSGRDISSKSDSPNHKALLAKDIVIVEYLSNTNQIDFNKKYEIIALPLKIAQADGSPSRVIIREA